MNNTLAITIGIFIGSSIFIGFAWWAWNWQNALFFALIFYGALAWAIADWWEEGRFNGHKP